jgi:hypothetical protein
MNNRNMVRVMAFFVNNILMRMFNQGIHIKESEFLEASVKLIIYVDPYLK